MGVFQLTASAKVLANSINCWKVNKASDDSSSQLSAEDITEQRHPFPLYLI